MAMPIHHPPSATACRYDISFDALGIRHVTFAWPDDVPPELAQSIIELMRRVTESTPIIGFGTTIDASQATAYVAELQANVPTGKSRLLTALDDRGALIGVCTVRRNLNPNNAHIADLAKGMIDERCRGGQVLTAAFSEIARRCQADGVELLTLDVRSGTRAHAVWQHFGFETYGVLDDYARAGGRSFAGHFMRQTVQALLDRTVNQLTRYGLKRRTAEAAA